MISGDAPDRHRRQLEDAYDPADAGELAATIARRTAEPDVVRVICPPFVCLASVAAALAGTGVDVGAQNVHHELAGAYTGEVSAPMLAGLATWVIVGHSERRRDAGETDELIGRKLDRAIEAGLRPILCVGEQLEDREAGAPGRRRRGTSWREPWRAAIRRALAEAGLVIAYEPVWAIGTGRNASGRDAAADGRDDPWRRFETSAGPSSPTRRRCSTAAA